MSDDDYIYDEATGEWRPASEIAAEKAAHAIPPLAAFVEWVVSATGAGLVGLAAGAALIPIVGHVFAPIWTRVMGARGHA